MKNKSKRDQNGLIFRSFLQNMGSENEKSFYKEMDRAPVEFCDLKKEDLILQNNQLFKQLKNLNEKNQAQQKEFEDLKTKFKFKKDFIKYQKNQQIEQLIQESKIKQQIFKTKSKVLLLEKTKEFYEFQEEKVFQDLIQEQMKKLQNKPQILQRKIKHYETQMGTNFDKKLLELNQVKNWLKIENSTLKQQIQLYQLKNKQSKKFDQKEKQKTYVFEPDNLFLEAKLQSKGKNVWHCLIYLRFLFIVQDLNMNQIKEIKEVLDQPYGLISAQKFLFLPIFEINLIQFIQRNEIETLQQDLQYIQQINIPIKYSQIGRSDFVFLQKCPQTVYQLIMKQTKKDLIKTFHELCEFCESFQLVPFQTNQEKQYKFNQLENCIERVNDQYMNIEEMDQMLEKSTQEKSKFNKYENDIGTSIGKDPNQSYNFLVQGSSNILKSDLNIQNYF